MNNNNNYNTYNYNDYGLTLHTQNPPADIPTYNSNPNQDNTNSRYGLKSHDGKHKCQYCNKGFGQQTDLTRHTGEKPFSYLDMNLIL